VEQAKAGGEPLEFALQKKRNGKEAKQTLVGGEIFLEFEIAEVAAVEVPLPSTGEQTAGGQQEARPIALMEECLLVICLALLAHSWCGLGTEDIVQWPWAAGMMLMCLLAVKGWRGCNRKRKAALVVTKPSTLLPTPTPKEDGTQPCTVVASTASPSPTPPPPLPLQPGVWPSNGSTDRRARVPAMVQLLEAKKHPMGDGPAGTVLFVVHRSTNKNTVVYKVNHSSAQLRMFWMMFEKVNGKVKGGHASAVQGDDPHSWPGVPTEELTQIEQSTYGADTTHFTTPTTLHLHPAQCLVPPTPVAGAKMKREVMTEVRLSSLKGRTIQLVRCTNNCFSQGFANGNTPARGAHVAASSSSTATATAEGGAVAWQATTEIGGARGAILQAMHIEYAASGFLPLQTIQYTELYGRDGEYELIETVAGSGEAARAEAVQAGWGTA
jgi:hypothetical protein